MSRSAHDGQELGAIEVELAASDPGLVAMLSTFSRLAADEAMPGWERIQAGRRPRPAAGPGSRGTTRRRWLARYSALAVWLTISIALIAAAVVLSHHSSSSGTCASWMDTACGTQAPARAPAGR